MADVFISYRRDDRHKAEALAKALKDEGLDVWWDASLQTGETFDEKIQSILQSTKAVIILWSPSAVSSEWVRGEGAIGRERGVLVPVMVKPVNIPVPFNMIQTADLCDWNGDRADPVYQGVAARVKELANKKDVKPLRPPPNRAMRRVWTAIIVLFIFAGAGASLWVFKPWEAIIAANDPVRKAKAKHDASLARIAPMGIHAGDLETQDWKTIAKKKFNPATFDALKAEANSGNAVAQAVFCSVNYWGVAGHDPDDQTAWTNCHASADAADPVGQLYYSILLEDRAFLSNDEDHKRADAAASAAETKKAADQGYSWGELEYGQRLESGDGGIPVDVPKALALYKSAQSKGVAMADYAIGQLYLKGAVNGVTDADGAAHIKAAADKGVETAAYRYGQLQLDGRGMPKDLKGALATFQLLSKSDNGDIAMRAKNMASSVERSITEETATPTPTP